MPNTISPHRSTEDLPFGSLPLGGSPSGRLPRFLTALPVYNEQAHLSIVLDEVTKYATDVLAVDDGSTDHTSNLLAARDDILVIHHPSNLGYGAALQTAFRYAIANKYEVLLMIDCDEQHEPQRIRQLVAACQGVDIVSGSRYLEIPPSEKIPPMNDAGHRDVSILGAPEDRRRINMQITKELNDTLGLELTDAFCGFKAYRVDSLARLQLTELGYAMPLELWVQAAYHDLQIIELPVPLIYLEEERSFGGSLDDGVTRLEYYRTVLDRALARCRLQDFGQASDGSQQNWKLCESGAQKCS